LFRMVGRSDVMVVDVARPEIRDGRGKSYLD